DGNLFGFERIHDLLQKTITAAEVATAAQKFGQQDDISVIVVQRALADSNGTVAEACAERETGPFTVPAAVRI
ncbi:MAG TPA: hypothetical protein VFN53_12955, partial [Acidobacteriaceae bacterium]|nr:hypothetical protein [Acidobacteriaceae bacterium]